MNEVIYAEVEPGIGLITLNRPERLNALNSAWITCFHEVLDTIDAAASVRAVIITGAGRGFCAGADLKSDETMLEGADGVREGYAGQKRLASLVERLTLLRQPVIAAVNGAAMGGGFAVTLGADIRIASSAAKFGVANVKVGVSAGECGMSWLFPRLVGLSRCMELLLTGRTFDAAEAERIGLVSRVVPPEALMEAAMETARAINANAPFAVMMSKEVIWSGVAAPDLRTALAIENRTQVLCNLTGDIKEAVAAFREKRPPNFGSA